MATDPLEPAACCSRKPPERGPSSIPGSARGRARLRARLVPARVRADGLNATLVQCSLSRTRTRGTLRGLHYQAPPYEEAKLVRCTMGAIYDVIVDLRPDSDTYMQHIGE